MGLERSSSTCKNVVTFATRKANLDSWELEWTPCIDFGVLCRRLVANCEEAHGIILSKLNCRSHVAENCVVAMVLGLRVGNQAHVGDERVYTF